MVKYIGKISRREVDDLLGKSRCGLLLYQSAENHISAMPNKLFEYMAAGIPIICSDFPLWEEMVEQVGAGICVRQDDVIAVANAIEYMLDNPDVAENMGKKGRETVEQRYNWNIEEKRLLKLYDELLSSDS